MNKLQCLVSQIIPNLTLICCLFFVQTAFSAPDPRDSIIIESKTVEPAVGKPAARVRVYVTNKDSLGGLSLSLVERSIFGNAYLNLAWPRTFDSVITRLTSTLDNQIMNGFRYQGTPPDTVAFFGGFNGSLDNLEPPNVVRKPFWEIRFDTVRSNAGVAELDSALFFFPPRSMLGTNFVKLPGIFIPVNFVKGTITVQFPPPPCIAKRLDIKEDGSLDMGDLVQLMNCAFLGQGDCKEAFTSVDVIILLNYIFLRNVPPPPTC